MMDPADLAVFTALTAAIGVMWKALGSEAKRLSRRADQCEKDRETMRQKLTSLDTRVAIFESCPVQDCGARASLKRARDFHVPTHPIK